jgi:hypothetical protein
MEHKIVDIDLKRHQLLGYLVNQLKIYRQFPKNNSAFVEFESLLFKMGCDKWDLDTIAAPLIDAKEIANYSMYGIQGLIVNNVGEATWASDKYKKLHQEELDKQIQRDISKYQKWHYKYFWYILIISSLISGLIGWVFGNF